MTARFLLQHLLAASADADPDATAVRLGDDALAYGALEHRSTRVARALRAEGVRPGDRVGLLLKKSTDAVVSLMGILKAGACVVPVTVGTPGTRFADIARQCAMRALITSADAAESLRLDEQELPELACVLLAGAGADAEPASPARLVRLADAEAAQEPEPLAIDTIDRDLAYVLFTSGSTGSPKGVMLSHRAVLTFVEWALATFAIRPDDRLSNHAPFNFDLSTFDLFAAMGAGASVTLIPEGLAMFPGRLAELIERVGITVWYSVPSVLTLLITRGRLDERDLGALRLVLFAGEVFPSKHLRRLMLGVPGPRYFNLYGPTETNVCTYHEVLEPPGDDDPPVPIGRACANTRTVVLDANGRPLTEAGAQGVLHVGGSSLMDGYFGRSEETAAAFVEHPLSPAGEPLYNTGDWVEIGPGGELLFLGRRDHMVKVGGYRIELGEIESALYAHPDVRDAAAVALPDDLLGHRIRAVVVPGGTATEVQDLRRHCGSVLPKYMVPHEIVFRDALPRTSNDKVDRTLLVREATGG